MNALKSHHMTPLVFERQAQWDGISLAHYRFRAGDVPDRTSRSSSAR